MCTALESKKCIKLTQSDKQMILCCTSEGCFSEAQIMHQSGEMELDLPGYKTDFTRMKTVHIEKVSK